MRIVLCTTPTCPRCEMVKDHLRKLSLSWEEIDISTPEGLTNAAIDEGIHTRFAPVIKIGNIIVMDLFSGDKFNAGFIDGLVRQ